MHILALVISVAVVSLSLSSSSVSRTLSRRSVPFSVITKLDLQSMECFFSRIRCKTLSPPGIVLSLAQWNRWQSTHGHSLFNARLRYLYGTLGPRGSPACHLAGKSIDRYDFRAYVLRFYVLKDQHDLKLQEGKQLNFKSVPYIAVTDNQYRHTSTSDTIT